MIEADLLKKLNGYKKEAEEHISFTDWKARAIPSFQFYYGNQWTADERAKPEAEGRPTLTYNHILPIINVLSGFERQNRQDIKVFPRKGGTTQAAAILTELAKHTIDICNGDWEQSMAFFDGIIGAKGWLSLDVDYQNDPLNGDLVAQRESPFNMFEDPLCNTYDLNKSARFVYKKFKWDKDTLILNFPKKESDIKHNMGLGDNTGEGGNSPDDDNYGKGLNPSQSNAPEDKSPPNSFVVREVYWKSWEWRKIIYNVQTLEKQIISDRKMGLAATIAKDFTDPRTGKPVYKIIDRLIPILHKTTYVGSLILEDIEDPFEGISLFPYFRFCPYWVDGYIFGVVDNLKDPQRGHNKNISQSLHHVNTSANSGFITEEGVVDINELKKFGSTPGHVIVKKVKGGYLERMTPVPLSPHVRLADQDSQEMKEISGVNADLQGANDKQEPGIVLQLRQRQGLVANEIIFDNYRYTQKIFSSAIIEYIRKSNIYSEEEIKSVVDESSITDKEKIKDFKTIKTGRYGIKVSQSKNVPTIRMANFLSMLDAVKMGVPIPPQMIVEASDWPNKEQILQSMKPPVNPQGAGGEGLPQPPQGIPR